MKKYAVRSDMEGLTGIVAYDDVIPGSAGYGKSKEILRKEIEALCEGLLQGGAQQVEIYDEHYYGLNIEAASLPKGTSVILGKPPYRADWRGGIDESFAGLILQGYHAMTGTEGGILPHTYEPDIKAIWINGTLVGEIGVEAAIAGEAGVPLVLLIGDAHGAEEAKALISGVETVVVKRGLGGERGLCRAWAEVCEEIVETCKKIVKTPPSAKPLLFPAPVEMKIDLFPGPFRSRLLNDHAILASPQKDGVTLRGRSVAAVWGDYWAVKDQVLFQLKNERKA